MSLTVCITTVFSYFWGLITGLGIDRYEFQRGKVLIRMSSVMGWGIDLSFFIGTRYWIPSKIPDNDMSGWREMLSGNTASWNVSWKLSGTQRNKYWNRPSPNLASTHPLINSSAWFIMSSVTQKKLYYKSGGRTLQPNFKEKIILMRSIYHLMDPGRLTGCENTVP